MSASSLSLPIFLRINFLISYLIVTDSQNTFDWHTQRALLNDKKAGAGCTSRAFKHPGRDVTAPDVWPSILTDYTYDSELDNADGVPPSVSTQLDVPGGEHSYMIPKYTSLQNNLESLDKTTYCNTKRVTVRMLMLIESTVCTSAETKVRVYSQNQSRSGEDVIHSISCALFISTTPFHLWINSSSCALNVLYIMLFLCHPHFLLCIYITAFFFLCFSPFPQEFNK